MTQPTLSMQLQKLEEELEVTLFDRSRKPVVPTQDGCILLDQFREVLRAYERVGEVAHELRGIVAGSYRLGIIPTMGPFVLPRLVPRFLDACPDVELEVEELTTGEIITRLEDETLDGGILAGPLRRPRILEVPLAQEPFSVFHAPDLVLPGGPTQPISIRDLPMERLIVMREGHCLRTQVLDLCALGAEAEAHREQRFVLQAGSMATLCGMVREGGFFTILPAMAIEELEARGEQHLVRPLAAPAPFREVVLAAHRTETRRAVREALIAEARGLLGDSG